MLLTRPPIALPANIAGVLPDERTWQSDPAEKITPVIINVILLPNLSPRGAAMRAPKKHPAWSRETMFAANASVVWVEAPLSPKSL
jgi:hypothetical protein